MTAASNSSRKSWTVGAIALLAAFGGGLALWRFYLQLGAGPGQKPVASPEVTSQFYSSLAALDVDSNEHAATLLKLAVQAEPLEPALWANLAVANLRLADMASARAALQQAEAHAAASPELAVLRAEILEQDGQVEPAIEQWREVLRERPDHIAGAYSLATLLGQIRAPAADDERLKVLSDILAIAPDNLRVLCEQARLAATLERPEAARSALENLRRREADWPEIARKQLARATESVEAGRFREAATQLTILENVVKPLPEYQDTLAEIGLATAIGSPVRHFLRLQAPPVEAAEADLKMSFEVTGATETAARPDFVLALPKEGERRSTLMSLSNSVLKAGEPAALPFPGSSKRAGLASLVAADLNGDVRQDLVLAGPAGCRVFLRQEGGAFQAHELDLPELARPWSSVWAFDLEADGDLDLAISDHRSPLGWLRNNGDMTFAYVDGPFEAKATVQLVAVDLDQDGSVDLAAVDAAGQLAVWLNQRGGTFAQTFPPAPKEPCLAVTAGDLDRDGRFDLLTLAANGEATRYSLGADGVWSAAALTTWAELAALSPAPKAGEVYLETADLDNNGAVDAIASTSGQTAVWLSDASGALTRLADAPKLFVTSVADMNADGLLDLVGLTKRAGAIALNRSQAGNTWQFIEPRANAGAGDKRINSFGVGGRIEVRAGSLTQAAPIRSPLVHFGLGRHAQADVARIVWPNGTVQAEFDLPAHESIVAQQRLKGSCPWVFAYDGAQFGFVKDFLWRSPLGLRINAQDTAGVSQTEDWIKISGKQLAAKDGRYLLRVTADLWETHFFDHVSLLAVDHPADVAIFVDERFVPREAQDRRVVVATPPRPMSRVTDHRGQSLDVELASTDGVYADGFSLGEYQGVAEEHWVEFALPVEVDPARDILLIANGWIYPTDSSLNVAISQGAASKPFDLMLEQLVENGQWQTLRGGLGFPAGKNKDAIVAIPPGSLAQSRRFRLRTNMEVYWDSLHWAYAVAGHSPRVNRVPLIEATLRARGFSKLAPTDRRRPDIPLYKVESTDARWLDLEGYYTRFGDVRPLLATIDDRYAIMNAGDELALEFQAMDEPHEGWVRDFVLVGDGWVKDGDFNTVCSRWVGPLPTHADAQYTGPLVPLQLDPAFLRNPDDWQTFHTRYVTPRRFQRGLWPAARDSLQEKAR